MNKLIQARQKKKESTRQTAEAVGVSQPHYFRVETGETMASPELAASLAEHFGVRVADLFQPGRYEARSAK